MLARLGWHRGPGAISDPWSKSRVAHRLTGSARSTGDLRRTVKTLVDESRRRVRETLQRLQRQRHKA